MLGYATGDWNNVGGADVVLVIIGPWVSCFVDRAGDLVALLSEKPVGGDEGTSALPSFVVGKNTGLASVRFSTVNMREGLSEDLLLGPLLGWFEKTYDTCVVGFEDGRKKGFEDG